MSSFLNRLSQGWGKNRKTVPLKNTLVHISASELTKNQIMNILQYNLANKINLSTNVLRAIEHRVKNLQNQNIRNFMIKYQRQKNMKRKNNPRHLIRNKNKNKNNKK